MPSRAKEKSPRQDDPPQPAAPARGYERRVLMSVAIVVAFLVLVYFLWQAVYVILLIFAGVLLAIFLRALADWLSLFTRLPTRWSLAIVIITLLALGAGFVWFAAPRVTAQAEQFVDAFPQAVAPVKQKLEQSKLGSWLIGPEMRERLFDPNGSALLARSADFFTNLSSALVSVIVIAFIGVYLAFEPTLYTNGLLRLLPKDHRPRGAEVLGALNHTLKWWLVAQFIDMWIIGTMIGVGLWLLGVKLAFMLGILAGLFNFIPNFGPLVSMVPATLIALMDSPTKAVAVLGLSVSMQCIEGYLLLPMLQRRAVDLPPVLTIAAQVLMGVLMGPLGLVLATPLMAVAMVSVQMLYVDQALGDDIETPVDKTKPEEIPPVPGEEESKSAA